jgi:hypothetical protein
LSLIFVFQFVKCFSVFVVRLLEANNKSFNLLGQPLDLGLEFGVLGLQFLVRYKGAVAENHKVLDLGLEAGVLGLEAGNLLKESFRMP